MMRHRFTNGVVASWDSSLIPTQVATELLSLKDLEAFKTVARVKEVQDKIWFEPAALKLSILQEAQDVIYGDREQTYGHPSKNIKNIAELWSVYLNKQVSMEDVCNLMILLKVARLKNQPTHRDSQVDICGYAALIARVQE